MTAAACGIALSMKAALQAGRKAASISITAARQTAER